MNIMEAFRPFPLPNPATIGRPNTDEMEERNEEIDMNGLIAMDECKRRS
jgi:hypothetical protein